MLEVLGKSSSCGWGSACGRAWPWPTALSPALCSLTEPNNEAFVPDKQMGMNWQGAWIPYNLISVYSAVSKESFVSKEHDSFGFATKYLLSDIFLFLVLLSLEKTKRRNGELDFQLPRKIICGQGRMDERPFTKRQIASGEDIMPLTSFYLSIKCCAASSIVIEGIEGVGNCGLPFTPRKLRRDR